MVANFLKYGLIIFCVSILGCKDSVVVPVEKTVKEVPPTTENTGLNSEVNDPDNRMVWQRPDVVIKALGNIENKVIADLGAGIGYFSFKLLSSAKKVICLLYTSPSPRDRG